MDQYGNEKENCQLLDTVEADSAEEALKKAAAPGDYIFEDDLSYFDVYAFELKSNKIIYLPDLFCGRIFSEKGVDINVADEIENLKWNCDDPTGLQLEKLEEFFRSVADEGKMRPIINVNVSGLDENERDVYVPKLKQIIMKEKYPMEKVCFVTNDNRLSRRKV